MEKKPNQPTECCYALDDSQLDGSDCHYPEDNINILSQNNGEMVINRPEVKKHFEGIPNEYHQVVEVFNRKTGRYNQNF